MTSGRKRVAILSPVAWRTPPRQYGAWETVASNLTEGLVARGWDVTLFATGGLDHRALACRPSSTGGTRRIPPPTPRWPSTSTSPDAFEHAAEFDLIHSHYDFMALTYTRLVTHPGAHHDPRLLLPEDHARVPGSTATATSSRSATPTARPGLSYLATVYNGIDLSLYPLQPSPGGDLIFLGRIHPDKGVHLAIEVARRSGLPLVIAGLIQDQAYFREEVEPHLDGRRIRYVGSVGVDGKNELFARARALLHLNTIPERFGLVLAEANAAGVPVVAMDLGSCREVVEDGRTGFLVQSAAEAVAGAREARRDRPRRLPRARPATVLHRLDGRRIRACLSHDLRARGQEAIMKPDIVRRYSGNPILTKADVPYPVETVHNAAAVRHRDAHRPAVSLPPAQRPLGDRPGARARTGFASRCGPSRFWCRPRRGSFAEYEEFGVEDPRICAMEGAYWITYSAYSRHGVRIALARTEDFIQVERVALISQPDMRNVVLFPQKFDGRYARLDRPHSEISPWSINISYSPDLVALGRFPGGHEAGPLPLGRDEDRPRRHADRHRPGLAAHLPRGLPDHGRGGLPPRGGPARPGGPLPHPRGLRRVDPAARRPLGASPATSPTWCSAAAPSPRTTAP